MYPTRRMTRDSNPVGVARTAVSHLRPPGVSDQDPMTMDDVDASTVLTQLHALFGQLPPDEQVVMLQGMAQLIDAHENGAGVGDPDMMNGEDEDLEPRGGRNGGYPVEEQGNNTGTGAADAGSRARQTSGFLSRFPMASHISIRG